MDGSQVTALTHVVTICLLTEPSTQTWDQVLRRGASCVPGEVEAEWVSFNVTASPALMWLHLREPSDGSPSTSSAVKKGELYAGWQKRVSEACLLVKMHMTAERSKLSLSHVTFEEKNAPWQFTKVYLTGWLTKKKIKYHFFKDIATYLMMGQVKMCTPKFLLSKNETGLY